MSERAATIFNGRYTLENTKTDERRTFMIRTQKEDRKFAPGKRIISLLRGPDNERDYFDFGFVYDEGIYVWRKHRGREQWSHYDWYAHMIWDIATKGRESEWFQKGYRLMIEKRCLRCGRVLTEPESLKTGIGPYCAGRV